MRFLKVKVCALVLSALFTASAAFAAGGGGGESSAGKESPVEKSDAEIAAARYSKKLSEVGTLENRVREGRAAVQALIKTQRSTAEREQQVQIVEQIKERHQQLKIDIEKYNTARAELIYNFPGKADATERKYMPLRTQSVQQMENEMGLDADLTRLKAEIDQKFKSTELKEQEEVQLKRQPAADSTKAEQPKRLRLER